MSFPLTFAAVFGVVAVRGFASTRRSGPALSIRGWRFVAGALIVVAAIATYGHWVGAVFASHGAAPRPLLLYLDCGDSGASNDDVVNTTALAATYRDAGYVEGQDLHFLVSPGDQHNEIYWARRFPGAIRFLLGKSP